MLKNIMGKFLVISIDQRDLIIFDFCGLTKTLLLWPFVFTTFALSTRLKLTE